MRILLQGGPRGGAILASPNMPAVKRHRVTTREEDGSVSEGEYVSANDITEHCGEFFVRYVWDGDAVPPPTREEKDTNPKDAIGCKKPPMSIVPCSALAQLGVAMLSGAVKYTPHNWRRAGVRASIYYDAMMRHLFKWWEGEDLDDESRVHHLAHVMACAAIIIDSENVGNMTDDRPVPVDPYESQGGDLYDLTEDILDAQS